ncbi:hypothetical protein [Candidatus Methylobacter oryzae]|uniref:Uncharacterized protein n=1 Tax=Candidatus Methylobacter oryzae TaxID=2497749 RepID=A0ABY3CCF0_9GAMM|nr:hypothetical protein [Candidatus Methylobacter oryzae]TRW97150.1 hypothetical protein EKO24_007730 [Candidatus Methylobacter oryzae]
MNLVKEGEYIERQKLLIEEILRAIKSELEDVETPEELIESLTGSIGFSVAILLDGAASIKLEDKELNPMLTFQIDEDKMLYSGGNSWMHEYVYRLLPKLFSNSKNS